MRPLGAVVFGRLGDLVGRKYTFLVTISLMGAATFVIGLLPDFAAIGIASPIVFVVMRMLQGLALGGEFGGAVTYVAEHAPHGRRAAWTSWVVMTGSLGLVLALVIILALRFALGDAQFLAVFQFAPALGLPPEPPGVPGAPLLVPQTRQRSFAAIMFPH